MFGKCRLEEAMSLQLNFSVAQNVATLSENTHESPCGWTSHLNKSRLDVKLCFRFVGSG